MNTFKKKLLTAVTVMALSPLAQAGLISFSDSHTASTTTWSDTLTVSQFDSSQGTLDTVDITFSANMLTDIFLNNNDATAQPTVGNVSVTTYGSFLGLGALSINLAADTGLQFLDADDGATGGLDEFFIGGLDETDIITMTIDASDTDFASFIGTGTISTVNLTALGGFGAQGGSNVEVIVNTVASADLNVTYNYTELTTPTTSVSEPASLAILGLGLLGFGLRRKQKSL